MRQSRQASYGGIIPIVVEFPPGLVLRRYLVFDMRAAREFVVVRTWRFSLLFLELAASSLELTASSQVFRKRRFLLAVAGAGVLLCELEKYCAGVLIGSIRSGKMSAFLTCCGPIDWRGCA